MFLSFECVGTRMKKEKEKGFFLVNGGKMFCHNKSSRIGQSVILVISDILVDTPEVQNAKYPVIKEVHIREKKTKKSDLRKGR